MQRAQNKKRIQQKANKGRLYLEKLENRVLLSVDLQPVDIGFSKGVPEVGEYIDILAEIKNAGEENVTENFYVDFLANGQSLTDGQGFLVEEDIAAGESILVQKSYQYLTGLPDVEIIIDTYNDIIETSENNNKLAKSFTVPKSDLSIVDLSHSFDPARHIQGTQLTFTATVQNLGPGGTIRDSTLAWMINRGTGWQLAERQDITTDFDVNNLNITTTKTFQLKVDYDVTEVMAFIDVDNDIEEINEWNNTKTTQISVPHPDLIVRDIWWEPSDPMDGEEVTFFAQVANVGEGGTTQPFDVSFIIDAGTSEAVNLGTQRVFTETYPWNQPSIIIGPWEAPFTNANFNTGSLNGWTIDDGLSLASDQDEHGVYLQMDTEGEAVSPMFAWPDYLSFDLRENGNTKVGQLTLSLLDPATGEKQTFWESKGAEEGEWIHYEVNTSYNPFHLENTQLILEYQTADGTTSIDIDNLQAKFRVSAGTIAHVSLGTWIASPGLHTITVMADAGNEIEEMGAENNQMTLTAVGDNPRLIIHDAEIVEGDEGEQGMLFMLELSQKTGQEVSVNYAAYDKTAKAGEDYLEQSGTVTFAPYQTEASIMVPIVGDELLEGREEFYVSLSNSMFAHIDDWRGLGVIQDNDAARMVVTTPAAPKNEIHDFDFYYVDMNDASTQELVIHNRGESPLTITEAALSGTAFSLYPHNGAGSGDDMVIPAGGEMTITLMFEPTAAGEFTETLTLATSDPYNGLYEIVISGVAASGPTTIDDHFLQQQNDSGVYRLDVLGNDLATDKGGILLLHTITQPAHGVVTMGFDADLMRYILIYRVTDYLGTETFSYTIQNEYGLQDTATVNVNIVSPFASVELDQKTVRSIVIRDLSGSEVTITASHLTVNVDVEGSKIDTKTVNGHVVITGEDLVIRNIYLPYTSTGRGNLYLRSRGNDEIVLENLSGYSLDTLYAQDMTLTGTLQLQNLNKSMMLGTIGPNANVLISESPRPVFISAESLSGRISTTIAQVRRLQLEEATAGTINSHTIDQILVRNGDLDAYVSTQHGIGQVIVEGDIRKWIRAASIDKIITRDGDLEGEITALTGSIGTVMINGDITGQLNADENLYKAIARGGAFTGTARAAEDIYLIQAETLNDALISAGGDVFKVVAQEDVIDSYIMGGYDIGLDMSFGLVFPSGGDLLTGGNVHQVTARGTFADSYIFAGVLPETEQTQSLPATGQMGEAGGVIGKVYFGEIDRNANDYFGLAAAKKIKQVRVGAERFMNTQDDLRFWVETGAGF